MFVEIKENAHKKEDEKEPRQSEWERNEKGED
jgi:hypothetical protein